jgi:hypothetical protein
MALDNVFTSLDNAWGWGHSWKKGPKIRRDDLVKSPSYLCCKKAVASSMWKIHLVQIWWDFVRKIGTIKAIRRYLGTIHTLVVRVWSIGFRVICGSCACFGTPDPTWQAIGTPKSNSVAKDRHNFHLHSTSGFEPYTTASQAPSTWHVVSTPKSSSVTEGRATRTCVTHAVELWCTCEHGH